MDRENKKVDFGMTGRRGKWFAAAGLAAVMSAAVWFTAMRMADKVDDVPHHAGYGEFIPVAESSGKAMDGCKAGNAANQSGMYGTAAKSQTHTNRAGTMWCVETADGEQASLVFDFGQVQPLGEMWVWNYNFADTTSPKSSFIHRGLKNIRIYTSADGDSWSELKGGDYPFQLAEADGSDRLRATNLNDGHSSPVRFGGIPAQYVKLVADTDPGKGNWSPIGQEERIFGLSEARFYRYAEEVVYKGGISPVQAVDSSGSETSHPEHVVNHYGMSGVNGKHDTHGNDVRTMWLASSGSPGAKEPASLTVDLGGTYPLGEMQAWNYNGVDGSGKILTDRGLKNVRIYYSIDRRDWTELKGEGYPYRLAKADGSGKLAATNLDGGKRQPIEFGGASARYVKLVPAGGAGTGNWEGEADGHALYGLSELRFYSTAGIAAEPAQEWTGLFSRYDGWTGADGIFSIPLNGNEAPGSATAPIKTLFLFSDTYVGSVNPVSHARESGGIVNNSVAMLDGSLPDPAAVRFEWAPKTADLALFTPKTPAAKAMPGSWYWLQDGIARGNKLYLFPLLMVKDPAQPPGFQFAIGGVSMVSVPLEADGPRYEIQEQVDTPLYRKLPDGSEMTFAAGIMDNTELAGAPHPDGYIYVYGYKSDTKGVKRLIAARTIPEQLETFQAWRYWNGSAWSTRMEEAATLMDGVSPELSVTPMKEGRWKGKYLLVYEKDSIGGMVTYAVADSPVGPFGPATPLFHTPEPEDGQGIITYNAKAHPHLSGKDELLITYNVNSTDAMANTVNGDIYRPRWLRLREIAPK
ncbi:discoidin domain-containing protein [Paenibacillus nasutitermitis]|uniref:DUF4185 domain-containing protein n=1 Tax=Paenibacillus nasutitermitis TaxID=1652958 RepID=A0A916Z9N2_9BACL|nr:discoidin domain-containing protein [Paenibacillus nasutitermitis]GGD83145.1 hypothetical protein GCM10010911_46690 [Paenibacillus nasutitermitis]